MSSGVSKSTVVVTRPKLATQELHLVFVNTPRAGELIPLGPSLRIGPDFVRLCLRELVRGRRAR